MTLIRIKLYYINYIFYKKNNFKLLNKMIYSTSKWNRFCQIKYTIRMTSAWNTIKFNWNMKITLAYKSYAHFQRWIIFWEHQNLSHTCAIIKRDSQQIFQVTGHLQLLYYSFWHIYYIDHVINHVTHVTRDFILITFTPELTSPWP